MTNNIEKYEYLKKLLKDYNKNNQSVKEYLMSDALSTAERLEYSLILENLTGDTDFQTIYETIYDVIRVKIEYTKQKMNITKEIGLGFKYIFDEYSNSKIILSFMATKMIEEILNEDDFELELHLNFKSAEQIRKIGINKLLINYISNYDKMLSSYLTSNISLLEDAKIELNKILNGWVDYENKKEKIKYNKMIEQVENYLSSVDTIFTPADVMYYIANKLGIIEKLAKYDNINQLVYQSILENISDDIFAELVNCPEEKEHYNAVKNIMTEALFEKSSITNIDFKRKLTKESLN